MWLDSLGRQTPSPAGPNPRLAPEAPAPGFSDSFPRNPASLPGGRATQTLFFFFFGRKGYLRGQGQSLSDLHPPVFPRPHPRRSTVLSGTTKVSPHPSLSSSSHHSPSSPCSRSSPLMLLFAWLHTPSALASPPPGSLLGFSRGQPDPGNNIAKCYPLSAHCTGVRHRVSGTGCQALCEVFTHTS